jgi:hypothetical protein
VATESLGRTSYAPELTVTPRQPRTSRVESGATAETRAGSQRWLAAGLLVIASGLAVVALLGPLAFELVEYRITETLRNQMIGLDAVSLFVGAPLALFAAVLALRGHVAGPALALGIGAYTSYMFVQYILGPDYADLPGDNERLFPLALLLFASGWAVALAGWRSLDVGRIGRSRRRDLVLGRVVLPVLGFLAFFRYLPALADAMSAAPEDGGWATLPGLPSSGRSRCSISASSSR